MFRETCHISPLIFIGFSVPKISSSGVSFMLLCRLRKAHHLLKEREEKIIGAVDNFAQKGVITW